MRAFCDSQSRISPNILLQSRALCRVLLQLLLVMSIAAGVVQRSALAIGGSDESSTEKVNQTSATCQDAIALAARTFIQSRTAAINSCLSAFIDCDEEATDLLAETCRNNLIYLDNGACAEGVLDSGSSTAGAASLAVETKGSSALIDQALITLVSSLDNGCFSGGQSSSDLSAANTGLGFSPTPATKYALADALNAIPAGVSCHSNEAIRKAYPLVDDIVSLLSVNDGKCIAVSNGVSLGTTCSSNTTCGATSGRCGKIASVLKNGGDSGFPSCPVICSPGQRISVNGYSCTSCTSGTYSSTLNANSCSDCSLGHYVSVSGSSTCLACAAGTYQALPGKSLCDDCPAGSFQASTGQSTCTNCAAGSTSTAGSISCSQCSAGKISASGAASCTNCTAGKEANAGRTACVACGLGTYSPTAGSACAPCLAGSYQATTGQSTCDACPLGTYSSSAGMSVCTNCSAGTYMNSTGATVCTNCAPGTSQPTAGQSSCTACAAGN